MIIDVRADNVQQIGFFCFMSKRKSEGFQRKLRWVKDRLAEGMRIKILASPERGFIEYLPGEHAWRPVNADGYMFIHCLWVVGKSKGKGLATALLEECIADAKSAGMRGVAMVTSEKVWLAGRRILERHGFDCVETAEPSFSLMVKRFGDWPLPSFAGDWNQKARSFGTGLTIVRSDQCPYIVDATVGATATAAEAGVQCRVVELNSRDDVMRLSPTPYGTFALVLDGRVLSYHYLLGKDLLPLLGAACSPGLGPGAAGQAELLG